MNTPRLLTEVAARYNLPPLEGASEVRGGLSHRLMRLDGARTSYAFKILSPRAIQTPAGRAQMERAEVVARCAQIAGLPAMTAIAGPDGNCVQDFSDAITAILYPWKNGQVLPPSGAIPAVCALMGELLGKLHGAQIRFPDQSAPIPEAFESGHFAALLENGEAQNALWCERVRGSLPKLENLNARAMRAQLQLQKNWVTGHLDFDQKNVLWDGGGNPTILDWESVKPIHPALEALGAGLSWAGQSAGQTSRESLRAFFESYETQFALQNEEVALASEAVLGKWLIWLEFNLRRSLEPDLSDSERQICHDALFHALGATLQLGDDVPLYREWLGVK